jgi:hypothetical protein
MPIITTLIIPHSSFLNPSLLNLLDLTKLGPVTMPSMSKFAHKSAIGLSLLAALVQAAPSA